MSVGACSVAIVIPCLGPEHVLRGDVGTEDAGLLRVGEQPVGGVAHRHPATSRMARSPCRPPRSAALAKARAWWRGSRPSRAPSQRPPCSGGTVATSSSAACADRRTPGCGTPPPAGRCGWGSAGRSCSPDPGAGPAGDVVERRVRPVLGERAAVAASSNLARLRRASARTSSQPSSSQQSLGGTALGVASLGVTWFRATSSSAAGVCCCCAHHSLSSLLSGVSLRIVTRSGHLRIFPHRTPMTDK